MRTVELITTGGTIEKTYDEGTGELFNRGSIVARMLRRLNLVDTEIRHRALMSKDSLHMTEEDREQIANAVKEAASTADAVLVLHGTDTLHLTGERLLESFAPAGPGVPIVLTGAMRPFEMKRSDALQNLTEALMASSLLPPGVYCVAHGRALKFPGVVKDRTKGTFTRSP
jgi:L-asparaginase